MATYLSSREHYELLLNKYNTWMFDCDGVLWHGDHLVDGAAEVLNILRKRGKHIIFVSNSSIKSRRSYKVKFDQLGIQATVDEIYGSAYAAAVYISSVMKLPKDKKVYVIGMSGIEEELRDEGISVTGGTDPTDNTLEPFDLANFALDPDVGAVLCGLDASFNYTKLSKAFQYLTRNPDCQFLVTNDDSTGPTADGLLLLAAGSINESLRFASGRDSLMIGKPSKIMLDCIQAKVHFDPRHTIMIGDRLDTDTLFGQAGGIATLLVLTGITSKEDITGPHASLVVPQYVTESIGDLRVLRSD